MTRFAVVALAHVATLVVIATAHGQTHDWQPCRTQSCVERVRKERAVHRVYPFCNTWRCVRRVTDIHRRRAVRAYAAVVGPYRGWLASVRACESGGNYAINTGNGFYGAYQFTLSSWAAVGGRGMPNLAPSHEQDYRAVRLLQLQGRGAWPVCG